jgi:hypothetical protein
MFHRGQRIIVTESSASGKTHPAVGDVGYLNNVHLFYKDRFILADGFFFAYKADKNRSRCERKRFIIDLGMSGNLRRKMQMVGLNRNFYVEKEENTVNLTSVGYWNSGGSRGLRDLPFVRGPHGIFPMESIIDKPVKIPIVNIKAFPGKYSMLNQYKEELDAWSRCFWPALSSHLVIFGSHDPISIPGRIKSLFVEIRDYIICESRGDSEFLRVSMTFF